jgi:predicted Fe-Mo cluster-binding NifX family protein
MKICVSSTGENLEANVDPRFGRCRYFLIVDSDTMNFDSILNDSYMASGGAGINAAQTVAKTGAKIVITGNIGPNAFQTLQAAGIKVITGANGFIKDIVKRYNDGDFKETDIPSVKSHFGMGNPNR